MIENNWDFGRDNEELFEFAMHEAQYRDYKSGAAKTRFEEEIENAKNQNSEKKSFFKMKEKQSPNRSAYPKEKANESEAIAAFLLYSLNYKPKSVIEHSNPENNVWNTIGFWRNILNVVVRYNSKDIEISYACSKNGNYEIQIGGEIINAKIEYLNEGEIDISVNGKKLFASVSAEKDGSFKVLINGQEFLMSRNDMLFEKSDLEDSETGIVSAAANNLYSPIPGKIFKLNVKEGDKVKKGDVVIVVDAMKMENNLVAKKDSVVKKIHVNLNQMVTGNFLLVELEDIA